MCESTKDFYCEICRKHTTHLVSGSGRKAGCLECGADKIVTRTGGLIVYETSRSGGRETRV